MSLSPGEFNQEDWKYKSSFWVEKPKSLKQFYLDYWKSSSEYPFGKSSTKEQ